MKYGLEQDDIKHINEVFAAHPKVKQVILFGSRAIGNYKNGSDIDLAVTGDALSFNEILNISNDLDGLGLLYKFDLQYLNSIKDPDVIEHINRVGIIFYA